MRKPGAIPSPVNCGEIGYSCPLPLRSGSGPMPFTLFRFVPGKASTNTSEPDRASHTRSSRETSLGMGLCVHYRSRFTWGVRKTRAQPCVVGLGQVVTRARVLAYKVLRGGAPRRAAARVQLRSRRARGRKFAVRGAFLPLEASL
jgi:hypothetical protein